ncbi:response regulator [Actinoplanes sp. NPDC049316]|uniref:response regulator n=1 Tax=Actinoplanes sp. NPDC049316 TaxID=3154727 RepID=UPI0034426D97
MVIMLIADESTEVRQALTRVLTRVGHHIVTTGDHFAALQLVRSTRPGLVILDACSPALRSVDLCRAIRGDPGSATAAIILTSACAVPSEIEAGLAAGADEFLFKPFRTDDVLSHAHALLSRPRPAPADPQGAWPRG